MRYIALFAVLASLALVACEDDEVKPVETVEYHNLTTRENVLLNLELSYNHRNITEFEKLLDGDFKFFASAGDVDGGVPAQWGRTEEESIHARMFSPGNPGTGPQCNGTRMDLVTEQGVSWSEINAPGGETWYLATLTYNFEISLAPDITYFTGPGSEMQIALRNAGSDAAPSWRLVRMADLGDLARAGQSSSTESITLGKAKALYPREFKDLTEKWHVLKNVELAYNERRIDPYDELLDENFTFFLAAGDVGGSLPESWGHAVELTANTHLLAPLTPGGYPRVESIRLDLRWDDPDGEPAIAWIELPNAGPQMTETWYTTTVFYNFQISVYPGLTYLSGPGSKAQFTIRNGGTDEAPHWQLVEMRDLGSDYLLSSATAQTTWGQVKALYR